MTQFFLSSQIFSPRSTSSSLKGLFLFLSLFSVFSPSFLTLSWSFQSLEIVGLDTLYLRPVSAKLRTALAHLYFQFRSISKSQSYRHTHRQHSTGARNHNRHTTANKDWKSIYFGMIMVLYWCHPDSTMLQNMALASFSTSSSVRLREVAFRSVPLRATYYSAKNRSLRHSVLLAGPFSYEAFS